MRNIFILLTIFSFVNTQAQYVNDAVESNWTFNQDSSTLFIQTNFNGSFNADGITNNFIKQAFSGDLITTAHKDEVSARNGENSKAGVLLNGGLFVSKEFKNKNFGIGFRVQGKEQLEVKYQPDFFDLIFRGNGYFENQTAEFSNTEAQSSAYITAGITPFYSNKEKGLTAGVELAYAKGVLFDQINVKRGNLFTATDGEYVDLDVQMDAYLSVDTAGNFETMNGSGFAFGAWVSQEIGEKGLFQFSVEDFGNISWTVKNSYQVDSSYYFDGININDLFDVDGEEFAFGQSSTIEDIMGVSAKEETVKQKLSAKIVAKYSHKLTDKLILSAAFQHRLNSFYKPHFSASGKYVLGSKAWVGAEVGFGGYGKLNYNIGGGIRTNNFGFNVKADFINFVANAEKSSGIGVQTSLQLFF